MTILSIDPGSEQSAWLLYDPADPEGRPVRRFAIDPNEALRSALRMGAFGHVEVIAIERIESYGMPVGREVFDTVWWSGRFAEAVAPVEVRQVPRRSVKLEVCGDTRAKDVNIHHALMDRFGGAGAKGTKAHPGPLYGISKDVWSALAIAVTVAAQEGFR